VPVYTSTHEWSTSMRRCSTSPGCICGSGPPTRRGSCTTQRQPLKLGGKAGGGETGGGQARTVAACALLAAGVRQTQVQPGRQCGCTFKGAKSIQRTACREMPSKSAQQNTQQK
jgi:hypothetical protein